MTDEIQTDRPDEARMASMPITGVTAYITVSDANAAADFYIRAFGATDVHRMRADDGKRLMHCQITINGGPLFLSDAFPEYGYALLTPQGYMLHLQVEDGRAWWDRAVEAGMEVVSEFKQEFWGDLYGQLRDPFGVTWSIGSRPAA